MLDPSSSIASVVALGDSLTEGTGATTVGNRWQQVLQGLLRDRLQPAGVAGADVPYLSAWPRMSPMPAGYGRTATAGVTQASYGLGLRAASVPAGENVTFTFTGTRARLLGTKGPAVGKYGIRLDGGAEVVVDGAAATLTSGQIIWDSGTLSAGAHTVLVQRSATTVASPGAVLPEGLMTYNGDTASGVRVVDSGRHGAIAASFWTSTAWHNAFAAIEGKQLLIMPWGANDATSGTTTAVFRSGVEQIIDAARAAGFAGMVMLPKMPKRGSADAGVWAEYLEVLDSIAAGDSAAMTVDVRSRFPDQGTAEAVARGLYVDEVHMSDAGQALLADILAEAIMPADWPDATTLTTRVAAAFGADLTADPDTWTWTDLSSRLLSAPIAIRAGRSAGAGQVSPGTCSVTLDNDDSALTPLHPLSPYWPNVELGTPLRVQVLWNGVWRDRFSGFADQWEPSYVPITAGEASSSVRVTASGVLRRFQQGTPLSASALRRTITGTSPLAYWPLEDGSDTAQGGSAVPGVNALAITGTAEFADIATWTSSLGYEVVYGTDALTDIADGGRLTAAVPASVATATAAGWTVGVCSDVTVGAALSADLVLAEVETAGGTHARWRLVITTTGRTQVIAYTSAGAATTVIDYPTVQTSMIPHSFAVWQSGGTIQAGYLWDGGAHFAAGSVAGTLAGVAAVTVNPTSTTATVPMPTGHLAVWAGHGLAHTDYFDGPIMLALFGYVWTGIGTAGAAPTGEPATQRLARLAAEDGLSITMPAVDAADEVMMGRQESGTAFDLYQECVDADQGLLYESGFGLGYLPRTARYNQPVTLTIDLATYATSSPDVLRPTYDDQDIRNRWTVERRDGSSAVAEDTTSQSRGVYKDSVELNLASDAGLLDQAAWRLHQTTVVDLRESAFPIDLAANPDLIEGWLSCGVGSRIVRTNPPAPHRPGPLDRLVDGWAETIGPRSWQVQVFPTPAAPWDVATADGDQRAAADGSTLAGDLTGDAMAVTEWDFASSVQGWTALTGAVAWDGGGALTLTPDGTSASAEARSPSTDGPTPGTTWQVTARVSVPVARTVAITIIWRTSANALISVTSTSVAVAADTVTTLTVSGVAPATTAKAMASVGEAGTPPTSHVLTVYDVELRGLQTVQVTSTSGNGPWTTDSAEFPVDLRVGGEQVTASAISGTGLTQTVTLSARGVNGVSRAWPAGTEVDMWQPAVAPL